MEGATGLERWLHRNSGLALLAVGLLLIGLGGFLIDIDAAATAVALSGAGALVLAVLLPRSEGQLKLGPGGLEILLKAVETRSDEAQLDPDERAEAIRTALDRVSQAQALLRLTSPRHGDLSPKNVFVSHTVPDWLLEQHIDEVAEEVVEDVSAMKEIPIDEVPQAALETIREETGAGDLPTLRHALRRGGRGAPRWHLDTDMGTWRVSRTRHGWDASRLPDQP